VNFSKWKMHFVIVVVVAVVDYVLIIVDFADVGDYVVDVVGANKI
jgi:hypothetical protein